MSESEKIVHQLIARMSDERFSVQESLALSQAAINCANAIAVLKNVDQADDLTDDAPDWVIQLRKSLQAMTGK